MLHRLPGLVLGVSLVVVSLPAGNAHGEEVPPFLFQGYLRSGLGASLGGADQQCFFGPGASAKFRLGNECETYFEATLVHQQGSAAKSSAPGFNTVLTLAGTSAARHDAMSTAPQFYGTPGQSGALLDTPFTLALREAYVQGHGVLGNTKPWIGMRLYRRQDVNPIDYFLLNNVGPGAGVEDIDVGIGKLHVALTRNTPTSHDNVPAQVNPDVRLSDLHLGGAGILEAVVIYGSTGKKGHADGTGGWEEDSGVVASLIHRFDLGENQFNRVTVQYGQGIFGGDGRSHTTLIDNFGADAATRIAAGEEAVRKARRKSSSFRAAEELNADLTKTVGVSLTALYLTTDFGGYMDPQGVKAPVKAETYLGARSLWLWNPSLGIAGEYGYTYVKNGVVTEGRYRSGGLQKVTIAPQVTAGDLWSRPQLRLFATFAQWDNAAKGTSGGAVYASSTSGFSTGAQVETAW